MLFRSTTGGYWTGSPKTSFEARGSGGNVVHVDPVHDLVIVWRWSAQTEEGFRRVVESIVR